MIWSSPPATPANAYSPYLASTAAAGLGGAGGVAGSRNNTSSWQGYDSTAADPSGFGNYFHDGLPEPNWDPNMSLFGDPLERTQISPATTYSSFSSSATSDAMGSLSLDAINGAAGASRMGGNAGGSSSYFYPTTVSPHQLRKAVTPTPNSSSESVHTALLAGENSDFDHPRSRTPLPSKHHSGKPRRDLPTKPTKSRHGRPDSSADRTALRIPQSSPIHHHEGTPRLKLTPLKPSTERPLLPPVTSGVLPSQAPPSIKRSDKDEFLIRSKESGMTYREIRKQGNFKEAESTLRGRYRTLTKSKEARVRKPEWQEKDVRRSPNPNPREPFTSP